MSMTPKNAKQLGTLIAKARADKGLSLRALSAQLGVAVGWVARVESGDYANPSASRLAKLAEVLDIEPSRIEHLTQGAASYGLPEPRVYFRSKLDLTPEQAERVERYIERLRRAG